MPICQGSCEMKINDSKVICKYSGLALEGLKRSCSMGNNGGVPSRVAEKKALPAHSLQRVGRGGSPSGGCSACHFMGGFPLLLSSRRIPCHWLSMSMMPRSSPHWGGHWSHRQWRQRRSWTSFTSHRLSSGFAL